MFSWLAKFMSRLWDGTDHSADVKLLAFAACVASIIVWLSLSLIHNNFDISDNWLTALQSFMVMTAAGIGIQSWAMKNTSKPEPKTPPVQP